jgi:hypothetical protein
VSETEDTVLGFAIFFGPAITALALATFSPLRHFRQPAKLLSIATASGAIATIVAIAARLRGTISEHAVYLIIGLSVLVGALISLLASSETISQKHRDELVRKSDDQSWRV